MATPAPAQDFIISSNPSIIYSLISGLVAVIMFLLWRKIDELSRDTKTGISDLYGLHRSCRDDLRREFVSLDKHEILKDKVEEISDDRKEKWKAFFAHKHNQSGRVEID